MLLFGYLRGKGARKMESMDLTASRDQLVVKSNTLIQKAKYDLTKPEQRIILYLISQIRPTDNDFRTYQFSIIDFCRICGIEKGGTTYNEIKRQIQSLADKSFWMRTEDGKESLLRWIAKAKIDKSGFLEIRIDEDLRPYLLNLVSNFTQYELCYVLRFKHKWSFRLYELAKSIHYHEEKPYKRRFEIEEFKRILGAENYKDYKSFNRFVLKPIVEEINTKTDKVITIEKIISKKKVVAIDVLVESKSMVEVIFLREEIEKDLGNPQVSIWELMGETIREESKQDETNS